MELTYEQKKVLKDYAQIKGLDYEVVLDAAQNLNEYFHLMIQEVKRSIRSFFDQYRPYIQAYKRYCHEQNVKFFKKKKSQRKNWSKWKTRRGRD